MSSASVFSQTASAGAATVSVGVPSLLEQVAAGISPGLKRWTASEVHAMIEQGLLHDGEPFELIDGLLVHKNRAAAGADPMTHGSEHIVAVMRLQRVDRQLDGTGYFLQTQLPIAISADDEPEPDAAVVRGQPTDYLAGMASARDCCLVVEVADSSLLHDRGAKQRMYARAGIPAYWIVNLRTSVIEVYEQPDAQSGEYRVRRDHQRGEKIDIALPKATVLSVQVDDILA
jgi:Uma2 family endonuclease